MKTEGKKNSVLEKKLDELESLLEAITLGNNNSSLKTLKREVELRFLFAKTLLAAEISSRPTDVDGEEDNEDTLDELACMAKRLNELEEAFKIIHLNLRDSDSGLVTQPKTSSMETNDGETGSVYSWVDSGPYEVGQAKEDLEEEEGEGEEEDGSSEERKETKLPVVAKVDDDEEVIREPKEKGWVGFGALVCFGLIGLVCGMISSFCYINGDDLKEEDFYLTPT